MNLRVSDEFAEKLERVAKKVGRPMASVLEAVGAPALEAVEADALFEADALAAWEAYQLGGNHVSSEAIETLFREARQRAETVAQARSQK